jgi:hypothetical protein
MAASNNAEMPSWGSGINSFRRLRTGADEDQAAYKLRFRERRCVDQTRLRSRTIGPKSNSVEAPLTPLLT